MPSRFPGMDPFLEREDWKDFHAGLIAVLRETLVQKLRPRYVVKTEETVYVSNEDERVPQSLRQLSLRILRSDDRNLVSALEILAPWNKTGTGRIQYVDRRNEFLVSPVNLIELDLLRGGERLPVLGRLPEADYFTFVCREQERPTAQVYAWTLKHPLPTIPIPLSPDDDECVLNLQAVFTTTFDRAGYDYSLNYHGEVIPPLSESAQTWVDELLNPRP